MTSNTDVTSPWVLTGGFTEADFAEKPVSHKVTHPLPSVPDTTRLHGPNLLKWHRFVEATLKARQLFKHRTEQPLSPTHPHCDAWEAEEHFILGCLSRTHLPRRSTTTSLIRKLLRTSGIRRLRFAVGMGITGTSLASSPALTSARGR